MARRVDIAVVGAGIYGVTAAYEAVRRGHSVALIDRGDLGGGASSNSLKILHGGLRYLPALDLSRARESVRERRRWLRLLPDLTAPLTCRLDGRGLSAKLLPLGLVANAIVSADRNRGVRPDRRLAAGRGRTWVDAIVVDTERALLSFVHAARSLAGEEFSVYTHAATRVEPTDNAFRVHVDDTTLDAERVVSTAPPASASRALSMNVIVDRPAPGGEVAVARPHPDDRRQVFFVPWRGVTMAGTYDRAYPVDPALPLRLDDAWIDEAVRWIGAAWPDGSAPTRREVLWVHAGHLPSDGTRLSRRTTIRESRPGWIEVAGVKYTTAYGVAIRALDRAWAARPAPSPRAALDTPLPDVDTRRDEFARNLDGGCDPIASGGPRRGDVVFAVRHEWAKTLDDVLLRRVLRRPGYPGTEVVDGVASILERELGWTASETNAQVESFDRHPQFAGNGGTR